MRLRAILIGLVAVIILGIITPRCDFLRLGANLGSTYMPVGTVFLFFFFAFVLNALLKVFKVGLKPQELLLIYAMMSVASGLPSNGFVNYLIPSITGPFYFATPENRFAETLQKLIPDWMAPKNPDAIKYLYEGLPKGASIPWNVWIVPLFWWTLLMLAVALVMFSLAVIMRKQWVENEKLVFPLVYMPIEMVEENSTGQQSLATPFFRNKLMWVFFAVPVIIYTIKGLHFYFPMVPDIPLFFNVRQFFVEKPWNAITRFHLRTIFSVIGLTYLVPVVTSFSIWFFYLFFEFQTLIGAILGFQMPIFPGGVNKAFHCYQTAGGFITLTILLFWAMRHHLRDGLKKIFKGGVTAEDKEESVSYRLAVLGIIGGLLFICFWATAAGVKLWTILLWLVIFFSMVIVTTRFVAESGLYYFMYHIFPFELMLPFTGSAPIGGPGIMTLLIFNQSIHREMRNALMPFFLNSFKMADTAKFKRSSVGLCMWLAIIVVIPVGYFSVLSMMYKYGALNTGGGGWWFTIIPRDVVSARAVRYITSPVLPNLKDALTMGGGGLVTIFLFWMRRIFLWWPFHPAGYIMAGINGTGEIWWSVFIGWIIKLCTLKFGGIKIYRRFMPAFLGLVLGEFVTLGGWVIIDLITGARGNTLLFL